MRKFQWFAGACALALLPACGAYAQVAPRAAPSADPQAAPAVGEIVVTAQKREQSQIDVPIAITAYSGAFLDKLDVRDFHDLTKFTPGFYVQNQSVNDAGFVIRGITTDSGDITDEPRVSVFQDGVDISKSRGTFIELLDIQRIEVDKGPQPTLYGRSSLIGAVDIIQNKASERGFDWNARVEGGDYDYGMVEGMVNMPLSDTLAVRVSGRYRRRDGYIDNLLGGDALNGVDDGAVRLAVNWKPTPRLNTDLIFNYEHDTPSAVSFKNATFVPSDPATGRVLGTTSPYTGAALSVPADFSAGSKLGINRTVWGVTELADYRIDQHFRVTSITAFRHFDDVEIFDPDGFSFPLLSAAEDTYDNQVSQEFRLNYDSRKLSGFVGISGFGEQGKYHVPIEVDERAALALVAGTLNRNNPVPPPLAQVDSVASTANTLLGLLGFGPSFLPLATAAAENFSTGHQEDYTDGNRVESFDVVADATYHVTDKLQISAGLRNSYEHKTTSFMSRNLNGASVLGALLKAPTLANLLAATVPGAPDLPNYGVQDNPTTNNGDTYRQGLDDDGLTWRANALYKLTPDASLYFTYAHGRRPEVLSVTGPASTEPDGAPVFTRVPAETVEDYEGGAKFNLLHRRLQLDLAGFDYDYSNFQTIQQVGTQFVTTNAGAAQDYGFEGQAMFRAAGWLDLFGTYTYTHGRFSSGAYEGNHFRLTPDNQLTAGLSARAPALGGVFEFTPSYVYRTKAYFDDDNARPELLTGALITPLVFNEYQNAYGVLDLRLSYRPDRGNWKVEFFMTNATDEKYLKDAGNTGEDVGLPTYIAGEPRMFGFAFSIKR